MRRVRKAIALLLCLALCLTLMPAAFAEEPGEEDFLIWEDEPAEEPAPADEPEVPFEEPEEPAFIFDEEDPADETPEEDPPEAETPEQDAEDNASKPVITTQPKSISVAAGETATVSVTASGTGLQYQWQYQAPGTTTWKNNTGAGYNTSSMTFKVSAGFNGRKYRCIVSNAAGSVTSDPAILTVITKPSITTQPKDVSVQAGKSVTLTLEASGEGLQYQWQYSTDGGVTWHDNTSAGCKTDTMTFTAKAGFNGRKYRCIASNAAGSVTSNPATLTVTAAVTKPTITTQPKSVSVAAGSTVTMSVKASGTGLKYQWQYSTDGGSTWTNNTSTGYNKSSMSFTVSAGFNGRKYRCIVSNSAGSVTSSAATITVATKPTITTQPKSVSVAAGSTVTMSVKASGTGLKYQWQYGTDGGSTWTNNTSTGYNKSSMSFTAKAAFSGRKYRCIVSNSVGSVTSAAATLTVTADTAKPTITTQPKNITTEAGTTVTFTIAASGEDLSYQWQYRTGSSGSWAYSTAASGKTKAYEVSATSGKNGWQYRCQVSNAGGTVYSNAVTLTVTTPTKPTITKQPASVTADEGTSAKFSVTASGSGLSYKWQFYSVVLPEWRDIENSEFTGYKTATLTVPVIAERDGYKFRCIVSNSAGSVTSGEATLTMTPVTTPTISKQPVSVATTIGSTATFSVTASGGGLSYKWQFYSVVLPEWRDIANSEFTGYRTATLKVPVTAERDGYKFRCIVSNSAGSVTSGEATLTASGVQINSTVFPDANFRSFVSENCDTDSSGVLSASEIGAVTEINCDNKSIASLKGVEHFSELKTLLCSGNQLTSLDVRGLTKLFQITCANNDLTALDVSGLTALSYLECNYNQLTRLNVSGCTALHTLYCNENALTSLDLRGCTRLNTVGCGENQLTSLLFGGQTAMARLICSNNPLTSLNVSGLSTINYIDCRSCLLSELDVTSITNLQTLNINGCPISEIDLSQNANLAYLDCRGTQITTLDVSGCPKLKDSYIKRDSGVTIIR